MIGNIRGMAVIICTYNRSPCPEKKGYSRKNPLAWSIESLLNQNISHFCEFIIIDDESTDYTASYLAELKTANDNAMLVHRNDVHVGLACSREIGINIANNHLIFMGDDDCYYPPKILEGALETFKWCLKNDPNTVALTLPIYIRSFWPKTFLPISEIGRFNADEEKCTTAFDCFPIDYFPHYPTCGPKKRYLKPFRTERLSGVFIGLREALKDSGVFPSDRFWANDYHELLVASLELQKKGYSIYHSPDPRIGIAHFKYGAVGRYRISLDSTVKNLISLPLRECTVTLEELINESRCDRFNTGCRLPLDKFAATEIGAFFGVILCLKPEWAYNWALRTYSSYVEKGLTISEVVVKSKLKERERLKIWQESISKGISYAETKLLSIDRDLIWGKIENKINNKQKYKSL